MMNVKKNLKLLQSQIDLKGTISMQVLTMTPIPFQNIQIFFIQVFTQHTRCLLPRNNVHFITHALEVSRLHITLAYAEY